MKEISKISHFIYIQRLSIANTLLYTNWVDANKWTVRTKISDNACEGITHSLLVTPTVNDVSQAEQAR